MIDISLNCFPWLLTMAGVLMLVLGIVCHTDNFMAFLVFKILSIFFGSIVLLDGIAHLLNLH